MQITRLAGVTALVAMACFVLGGSTSSCSDGPAVGSDCAADGDCGGSGLKCFCVHGAPDGGPNGYVPGTCSEPCTSAADCAHLGSDMSCAKDLCTGVNVCLQNYSGPTLP